MSRTSAPTAETANVDDGLTQAAAAFFPTATVIEPAAGRRHIARVETPEGAWCLRRWPLDTPRQRIDFVQTLLTSLRDAGITVVPSVASTPDGGATVVNVDGDAYDAQSWLPGRTPQRGPELFDERGRLINRPNPLSSAAMTAAIRAIAALHTASETLAADPDAPRASLEAVLRTVRATWDAQRQRLRTLAPRTPHIQRWIRTGEVVFDGAESSITAAHFLQERPRVVSHLNLWPAHLLFARPGGEEAVTGIVDFASAAAASPLLDLAHIVTHFNGWTGAAAEEAIGTYADARALAPEERRLLPAIAGLDLIVETGRLLIDGFATPALTEAGGTDTLRAGASAMLLSLEAIAPAVQRGDRPEPSRARKWDYGPPKPRAQRPGSGPRSDRQPKKPSR